MSNVSSERAYPLRLRLLIGGVLVAATPVVAGAGVEIVADPPRTSVLFGAAVFLVLAFLADLKPVPLDETGNRSVSLAFVFILSSQILFGWQLAVVSAAASVLVPQLIERRPPLRLLFNTGVYALAALASGIPVFAVGRVEGTDTVNVTAWSFAGGAAFVAVNIGLVCLAVSLFQRVALRPLLADNLQHGGPAFLTMAFLAALAVVLWRTEPSLLILLAGPMAALTLYQRSALQSRIATRDAQTDSLTGLGNHRAYELELALALERAQVDGTPLSLCFVDVDDFKAINDRHGHPIGDAVLKDVAALLAEIAGARAYRFGGDEFALLLEQGGAEATVTVERLLGQVSGTGFATGAPVALSVGIVVHPEHGADVAELERRVDSALYWAKNQGKSRYCLYDPSVVRLLTPDELAQRATRQARLQAAEEFIRVVDAKDTYTGQHSLSVATLAEAIATRLELEPDVVAQVRLAGLLHDLGKIALPDTLLSKPGPLDLHELRLMRTHPELGQSLLDGLDLDPVDTWILHHHEHWDGTGYPLGLEGRAIPVGSRIILVADAFDAIVSDRSYRKARTVQEALAEIRALAGRQFDPDAVAALEAYFGVERSQAPIRIGLVA